MDKNTLLREAIELRNSLADILRRMTEPDNDWEAYNDYRFDQVEQMYIQACRRVARRQVAAAQEE